MQKIVCRIISVTFTVVGMQTCEHRPLTGTLPVAGTLPVVGTPPHPDIRHPRLGRLVALAVGAFLLPWCAVLGATLPASAHVPNWSLAWVGLDLAEAVAALLTATLLTRGSPRAAIPAAAGPRCCSPTPGSISARRRPAWTGC
jgi:hypothetical protein